MEENCLDMYDQAEPQDDNAGEVMEMRVNENMEGCCRDSGGSRWKQQNDYIAR